MISQADLELHLGLSADTDTALLIDLEAAAVAFVESETHRYFGAAFEEVEYVRGDDTGVLWLDGPVNSVTSVQYRAYPGGDLTTVTAADDDGYEVRDSRLYRKGGSTWYRAYEWVVTYQKGYTQVDAGPPADVAAPDDVRKLAIAVVRHWYDMRRRKGGLTPGVQSESLSDYSYSLQPSGSAKAALLSAIGEHAATIERHRRVFV